MKVLAIILVVILLYFGIPHARQGEWIAPNVVPPYWWGLEYAPENSNLLASPEQGYGWYRYDFWNYPSTSGRPVDWYDLRN